MSDTADFFRCRLDQTIDLHHLLAVLASRMPWQEIEAAIAHRFPGTCARACPSWVGGAFRCA